MKLRICFGKTEEGRYLSHLDMARTWERCFRRAKAPLAFSEGFNPHPKLSFASALAVGMTGRREYIDVELVSRVNIGLFGQSLGRVLPPALSFVAAEEIGEGSKSLSAVVNLAVYRINAEIETKDAGKLEAGIAGVLDAVELWRKPKEKPGKKPIPAKEVRGLIRRIEVVESFVQLGNEAEPRATVTLEMELNLQGDGQLRPQELWEMIGATGGFVPERPLQTSREALLIRQGEKIFSPMEGV